MNTLQKTFNGHHIAFIDLPEIITDIAEQSPSGFVKLPGGAKAYFQLHRNLKAKQQQPRPATRVVVDEILKAIETMIESDAFREKYQLEKSFVLDDRNRLARVIQSLVEATNNRVTYMASYHGERRARIESILIPIAHGIVVNCVRGTENPPVRRDNEITGLLYLRGSYVGQEDAPKKAYHFTIRSQSFTLSDFVSGGLLIEEIKKRLARCVPDMVEDPVVEFTDNKQFQTYLEKSITRLSKEFSATKQ